MSIASKILSSIVLFAVGTLVWGLVRELWGSGFIAATANSITALLILWIWSRRREITTAPSQDRAVLAQSTGPEVAGAVPPINRSNESPEFPAPINANVSGEKPSHEPDTRQPAATKLPDSIAPSDFGKYAWLAVLLMGSIWGILGIASSGGHLQRHQHLLCQQPGNPATLKLLISQPWPLLLGEPNISMELDNMHWTYKITSISNSDYKASDGWLDAASTIDIDRITGRAHWRLTVFKEEPPATAEKKISADEDFETIMNIVSNSFKCGDIPQKYCASYINKTFDRREFYLQCSVARAIF